MCCRSVWVGHVFRALPTPSTQLLLVVTYVNIYYCEQCDVHEVNMQWCRLSGVSDLAASRWVNNPDAVWRGPGIVSCPARKVFVKRVTTTKSPEIVVWIDPRGCVYRGLRAPKPRDRRVLRVDGTANREPWRCSDWSKFKCLAYYSDFTCRIVLFEYLPALVK